MTFTHAPRTIDYSLLRFVSENGRWEVGAFPVIFGVRIGAGVVGEQSYEVNYCAGADRVFAIELLATVVRILSALPEDVTPGYVRELMPDYKRKPIDRDPCWQKLQDLADRLENKNAAPVVGSGAAKC